MEFLSQEEWNWDWVIEFCSDFYVGDVAPWRPDIKELQAPQPQQKNWPESLHSETGGRTQDVVLK